MTRPEVRVSRPPRILIKVVLPEPDGPMSATHSPGATVKVTSSRARNEPYCLTNDSTTTCGEFFVVIRSDEYEARGLTLPPEHRGGRNIGEAPKRIGANDGDKNCEGHRNRIHNESRARCHTEYCFAKP